MRYRKLLHLLLMQIIVLYTSDVVSHGVKLVYTPESSEPISLSSVGLQAMESKQYIFEVKVIRNASKTYERQPSASIELIESMDKSMTIVIHPNVAILYQGKEKDRVVLSMEDRYKNINFLKEDNFTKYGFSWENNKIKFGIYIPSAPGMFLPLLNYDGIMNFKEINISTSDSSGLWSFESVKKCDKYMDLIIAIDSSSSLSDEEFNMTKIFTRNIVCGLGLGKTRFGSLAFGTNVDEITDLSNTDENSINEMLDAYPKMSDGIVLTRTDKAIYKIIEIFSKDKRPGVPQVGLIITDGKATYSVNAAARNASTSGIILLAVGTGPYANSNFFNKTLIDIAGGYENNTFQAKDYFNQLNNAYVQALDAACSIALDTLPTTTEPTTTPEATTPAPRKLNYFTGPADVVFSFDHCQADSIDRFKDFKEFLEIFIRHLRLGEIDVNLKVGSYCSNYRQIASVDDFTGYHIDNTFVSPSVGADIILVLFIVSHENDVKLNEMISSLEKRYGSKFKVFAVGFRELVNHNKVIYLEQKLMKLTGSTNGERQMIQTTYDFAMKGNMELLQKIQSVVSQSTGEVNFRTWVDSNIAYLTKQAYININTSISALEGGLETMSPSVLNPVLFIQNEAILASLSNQIAIAPHNVDNTNTHLAIAEIRKSLSMLGDGRKVGIIFTDGPPANPVLTMLQSLRAGSEGIELYAIGDGSATLEDLLAITSGRKDRITIPFPKDRVVFKSVLENIVGNDATALAVAVDSSNSVSELDLINLKGLLFSYSLTLIGSETKVGFSIFNDWAHRVTSFQKLDSNNIKELISLKHLKNYPASHEAINSAIHMQASMPSMKKKYLIVITDHISTPSPSDSPLIKDAVEKAAMHGIILIPIGFNMDDKELLIMAGNDMSRVLSFNGPTINYADVFDALLKKLDTTSPIDVIMAVANTARNNFKGLINSFIDYASDAKSKVENYGIHIFGHDYSTDVTGYRDHLNAQYIKALVSQAREPTRNKKSVDQSIAEFNKILFEEKQSPLVPRIGVLVTNGQSSIENMYKTIGSINMASNLGIELLVMGVESTNYALTHRIKKDNSHLSQNMTIFKTAGMSWLLDKLQTTFVQNDQCNGMVNGKKFAVTSQCHAYYECIDFTSVLRFCHDEFVFNEVSGVCDIRSDSNCLSIPRVKSGVLCDKFVDVGIAIDSSTSLSSTEFAALKRFANSLVQGLAISTGKAEFAAVTFGNTVQNISIFDDSIPVIMSKLENHPRESSPDGFVVTNTHLGINHVTNLLKSHPKLIVENRSNVPKVGIIITDGKSTNVQKVMQEANIANQKGVNFLAVGVNIDGTVRQELNYIAQNNAKNTFESHDFQDALVLKADDVLKRVCELGSIIDPTITTTTTTTSTTTTTPTTTTSSTTTATTTTTITTSTTPSTTTQRPEDIIVAKMCEMEDCLISPVYSLVPVEGNCRQYRICTRINETSPWKIHLAQCSPQLFWNNVINACDWPHQANCPTDPCIGQQDHYTYGLQPGCNIYFECEENKSYCKVCGQGQIFVDGLGCLLDKSGQGSTCLPQPIKPATCLFEATTTDVSKYIFKKTGDVMACPAGTRFYAQGCECREYGPNELPTGGLGDDNKCKSLDEMESSHQILNELASKTPTIFHIGDVKQLDILSSMDFKSSLAITFKVKATTLPANGNVAIFENCKSESGSTIKVWMNKTTVEAKLKLNNDKMISVSVPSLQNRWADVVYFYDGTKFVLRVDKEETKLQTNGDIQICKSGLAIGSKRDFAGEIKEFKIYKCIPASLKRRRRK